ncbi:MAG: restriction endonuclease [Burkholderiales bacterium]
MNSRKRRRGLLDEIADAIPLPPWWGWVVLAVVSYLVLHWLAGLSVPQPTRSSQVVPSIVHGLLKGIAFGAQFLIPPLLLLVAGVVFVRRSREASARRPAPTEPGWSRGRSSGAGQTDKAEGDDPYQAWKDADSPESTEVDESRWSMDLLRALEWKRFEILCSNYFEAIGFRTRRTHAGADGGVDIRLYTEGASAPGVFVQCKAWRDRQVGVALVRELFGVMTAESVAEGILVTTSSFSADAVAFAKGKNIHLIDGENFLGKLLALDSIRQDTLRKSVTEGDYRTPTCPSCGDGTKMRLGVSTKDGARFWGCSTFPACRTTMRAARTE